MDCPVRTGTVNLIYMELKRIFYSVVLLIAMVVLPGKGAEWKLYSSFDNNPVKIMDTPEKTYFLVHQQYYRKGFEGYGFPSLALFEYDKSKPEEGIVALVSKIKLGGSGIRLAEYSPAGGYLLVAYDTGAVDLIYPAGEVKRISADSLTDLPGARTYNTVTFALQGGDAWLASDTGYVHIDGEEGKIIDAVMLGQPLSWVGECGDGLIAVADGALYEAKSKNAASFNEFTLLEGIDKVLAIMPLTENEIGCLSGTKGGNVPVLLCKHGEEGWNTETLGTSIFSSLGDNFCVTQNYEGNIIPNRDGYLLSSADKVWELKRLAEDENARLVQIPLNGTMLPVGSWDFENFWAYKDRGKFRQYAVSQTDETVAWNEVGEAIRPDAPAAFICTYMNHSPQFGQLIVNHGRTRYLVNDEPTTPMLLSGIKNGHWKIYSPVYDTPRSVEANPEFLTIYNTNLKFFPVHDPHGLGIDPLFPERISLGSMFSGMTILDLNDIKKDPIRFAAPNDYFRTFPGYIEAAPLQIWRTACHFTNPDFDTEGRMWVINGNLQQSGGSTVKGKLKYMDAERRKTLFESDPANYNLLNNWETINFPTNLSPWWDVQMICGKHPKNKNKVIFTTGAQPCTLAIFDHNGEPENPAAHNFKIIRKLKEEKGCVNSMYYTATLAENPITGEIVIGAFDGLYTINPDEEVNGKIINCKRFILTEGSPGDIVPSKAFIYKVIFDDEGRMWVGTRHGGVVGVNRDCTQVIARYNTENSPLPSNCAFGLGWNPETRSLMISTDRGLAEVFPDLPDSDVTSGAPTLSITAVAPDYNGSVEIRNLPPQQNIVVKDADGLEIRRLSNGMSAIIEWDFKDNSGAAVPAGTYSVNIGNYEPLYISVMR